MTKRKYDLLAVGELLVDFIASHKTESLLQSTHFERFQGGSPANLAANMSKLGGNVALVSCVGNDNLGKFMIQKIADAGIDTVNIAVVDEQPSSIVVVSRTTGTPDFIAYRMADRMLQSHHISDELLANSAIFHTTCFALSQKPAQTTIVEAAKRAHNAGCRVSIDANYAPSIWPNREEAWTILNQYCSYHAFVKLSEDDADRLYNKTVDSEQVISDFHKKGAELVCFTMGSKGAIISYENGAKRYNLQPKKVEVIDATGAGDAFWSGFLTAYIDGKSIEICGEAGSQIAVLKIKTLGPLPDLIDKSFLYN